MSDISFINIVNACPRMVRDAVVVSAFLGFVLLVNRMLRNTALGGVLVGLFLGVLVVVGMPFALLSVFGDADFIRQSSYCPNCAAPLEVRELREQGALAAAEERGRLFLRDELTRQEGGYEIVAGESCVADGEVELAKVLLEKAGGVATSVETMSFVEATSYSACDASIAEANQYLDEALGLAQKHAGMGEDLERTINERRKNLDLIAKSCVPPIVETRVTFEYDSQQIRDDMAQMRLKMFTDGQQTMGSANLIELRQMNGAVIDADVQEVIASDAVCMLFLADNSGSLKNLESNPLGLEPVKEAVRTLNAVRKDNDYVSMVTFGTTVDVKNARGLGFDALNPDLINGNSGDTAIWDALDYGITRMGDECLVDKKYLILMTDGVDTASKYLETVPYQAADDDTARDRLQKRLNATVADMSVRARAADIEMYIIAVGAGGNDEFQRAAFLELVEGKRYYEVGFAGLAAQLKEIFGYQEDHYLIRFGEDDLGVEQKVKVGLKTGNTEVVIDFSNPTP